MTVMTKWKLCTTIVQIKTYSLLFRETKVVVRAENTQALMDLENAAVSKGVPTFLVTDAGKTQVRSF